MGQKLTTELYILMVKFIIAILEPFSAHMRSRGHTMMYWVVTEDDEFELCTKIGELDAIMTDKPAYWAKRYWKSE